MNRIKLKLLTREDVTDEYISWHTAKHTKYFSSSNRSFEKAALISQLDQGIISQNLYHYGIIHIAQNKLIGVIKLGVISKVHMTSDMVVLIGDKDFLGMGLAPEAIRLGNKIAFDTYQIRKLFGGMYKNNIGSVKAYLKANWVIEGVLKKHYLVDGAAQDRILVACFNPKMYKENYHVNGLFTFEEVYGEES